MIRERVRRLLSQIPSSVAVVAATKKRKPEAINEAIDAGIKIIGENYVQEAERKYEIIGKSVAWHFIGHLQRNKVKKAVRLFDVIATLDSVELAHLIDRESQRCNKIMSTMIEVNAASEPQKTGIVPGDLETFVDKVIAFKHIRLIGLMTMGPLLDDGQHLRPYFRKTKQLFDAIKARYRDRLDLKYLSMGMSTSYRAAIEEGATMIRLGEIIFGPR